MKYIISIILLLTSMERNTMANNSVTVLKYLVRKPTILTDNPPVLILLHGVGSNEQDLFSFANRLPGKYLVISARAPITLSPNSFAWYEVDFSTGKPVYNLKQEEASREILEHFILQIKEKYAVENSELYLCDLAKGQ